MIAFLPALIAGALSASVTVAANYFATTALMAGVWASFATSAVLTLATSLLAPKPDLGLLQSQNDAVQDRKQMVRAPLSARRIVYGRSKVSGTIVFIESSNNNQDLYIIVAIAGHEIDGVERIYVGDTPVAFDDHLPTGFRDTVQASEFLGKLKMQVLLGTDTQTLPSDFTTNTELTTNDQFKGIACICVKLTFDQDVFPNGIPTISAIIRGKKILDLERQALGLSPDVIYTNNPAYIFRDYLKDTQYGLSVADSELDDDQIKDEGVFANGNILHADLGDNRQFQAQSADTNANTTSMLARMHYIHDGANITLHDGDRIKTVTDEDGFSRFSIMYVIISDGLTKLHNTNRRAQSFKLASTATNWKRRFADVTIQASATTLFTRVTEIKYSCDGTLLSSASHKDNITQILSSCGGSMTYTGGVFRMAVSRYVAPSVSLSDDDFVGDIELKPKVPRRDRFNGVKGTFIGPENDWQGADFPAFQQTSFSNADGQVIYRDFTQNMCISNFQAQRVAKTILFQSRNEITMSCVVNLKGLQLLPNDRVNITNTRFGFTNQIFKVMDMTLGTTADNGIGVNLVLQEDTSQAYDFDSNAEQVIVDPTPDTILPTFRTVATPTISSFTNVGDLNNDGVLLSSAKLVFAESTTGFVKKTEVELQVNLNNNFLTQSTQSLASGITETRFGGLIVGRTYRVKVTCHTIHDVRSATATSNNLVITADTTAPNIFTGLTATGIGGGVLLEFTNPSDADFRGAEFVMQTGTGNPNSGSPTINFSVTGAPSKAMKITRDGLTVGTQQRFWIRSIDFTGNTSAFFPDNANGITATPIAGGTDVRNSSGTSIVSNGVATLGALGTVDQITSGNSGSLIGNDAIVTAHLSADCVTADEIFVGDLSSVSATIGTLRTATSGARMEVHSDKIQVFDSNGNERVRLGNLS